MVKYIFHYITNDFLSPRISDKSFKRVADTATLFPSSVILKKGRWSKKINDFYEFKSGVFEAKYIKTTLKFASNPLVN